SRYSFDDATGQDTQGTHLFSTIDKTRQQYLTAVGTHIFSLHALAVFRFGYTRPSDSANSLYDIEIQRSLNFVPEATNLGQIQIPGLSTFGPSTLNPRRENIDTFQFETQVLMQKGRHALKFGADVHRYRWDIFSDFYKGAAWSFNSLSSFLEGGTI